MGASAFGKYEAIEFSAENKKQLFIPRGFAHGFLVLSDFATFSYKVDNYYAPYHDRELVYNSVDIGIVWLMPENELKLSSKDKLLPELSNMYSFDYNSSLYV
jgi:dTDP-4-dehydrorhamnose 3,5-epimerase